MSDITEVLKLMPQDAAAADQLLALVYDELRRSAQAHLRKEAAGHTLQATALVHEVYLRLVGSHDPSLWESRNYFFQAAALAMQRILVESARRKQRLKRGGDLQRHDWSDFDAADVAAPEIDADLIDLDAALQKLQVEHPRKADVIRLRYFAGLTISETAEVLGISTNTADRDWAYARAWLLREMSGPSAPATEDSVHS